MLQTCFWCATRINFQISQGGALRIVWSNCKSQLGQKLVPLNRNRHLRQYENVLTVAMMGAHCLSSLAKPVFLCNVLDIGSSNLTYIVLLSESLTQASGYDLMFQVINLSNDPRDLCCMLITLSSLYMNIKIRHRHSENFSVHILCWILALIETICFPKAWMCL